MKASKIFPKLRTRNTVFAIPREVHVPGSGVKV